MSFLQAIDGINPMEIFPNNLDRKNVKYVDEEEVLDEKTDEIYLILAFFANPFWSPSGLCFPSKEEIVK